MFRLPMRGLTTRLQARPGSSRVRRGQRRWALEGLEARVLLSGSPTMYMVDLTSDTGTSTSTFAGDLLYCITQADANPNTAGSEIQFAQSVFSAATPQTIKLSKTLDLTETAGPELIHGPGAGIVTISGNNAVEVFDEPQDNVTATLLGLTISGGMTNSTGGGINNDGTLTVTNCTIANNLAAFGAGIYNDGVLTVTGTSIQSDSASEFGGGIDNDDGGILTVTNTTIAKNSAVEKGGGILNVGGSTLVLTNSTVSDNKAASGGGIDNNSSKLTVTTSTISGNESTGTTGNDGGGGVYDSGGTASITGSTFSSNSAVAGGGGIYQGGGVLTIADSTLSDNSVSGPSGPGGGIDENSGTLSITNSTVAGNTAQGFGAGIQENDGALTAVNCTIAYNTEPSTASGFGGGMNVTEGPVTLDNTIIALNTDGPALGGPSDNLYSEANDVSSASADNLIGIGGGAGMESGSNGNQVGVAIPLLGTLADNGGPTETIALLAHSPAIDNGSATITGVTLPGTDQRGAGFPRIVNGTVDIGAFERPIVTANPTVYMVDLTSDDGASTSALAGDLLYCITQADASTSLAGSEIEFSPIVFATPQTITLTTTLDLSEPSGPEMIDGPGANLVTVSGNKAIEVFDVQEAAAMASLSGLTIANGLADSGGVGFTGGGIGNSGTLAVANCTLSGNTAASGGGIENVGILTIASSTLSGNSAVGDEGGGIDNSGMLTINGSTLSGNIGVAANAVEGGGIFNDLGTLIVSNSTLSGNSAELGGGFQNYQGIVTLSDSTLSGNSASTSGGGICNEGTLTVGGSSFESNTAAGGDGAGIDNAQDGMATIAGTTFSENSAYALGGAIYNANTLAIANCTVSDNSASSGAGLDNVGTLNIFSSTISNNTATGNSSDSVGGGIENSGNLTVTNSCLDSNSVTAAGGGIFNSGTLTLTNSTLADNNGGSGFGGGGVCNDELLTAVNCTIAYNLVDAGGSGGGLSEGNGTVTLYNTIVELNTLGTGSSAPASDIAGTVSLASEYNLIGTGGAGGLMDLVNHNHVGVADPGLDPNGLQDNGGPTQTIALLASSPALGNASATITGVAVPDTDERGFPRTGGIDIGAFQLDPVPTTIYVDNAYASDAPGTAVTWTDGSTHYVGYDAFGTIQAGAAAVPSVASVDVFINSGDRYVATPGSGNTSLDVTFDGNPDGSIPAGDTLAFSGSGGTVTINGESGSASDNFTIEDTSVQFNAADGLHGTTIQFTGSGISRNVVAEGTSNTFDITGAGGSGPSGDLEGDAGTNAFVFAATGKVLGNITGGGKSTLNYAASSTGVTVNLGNGTNGTATGVSGTVTGVTAVIGSNGNDTLSAGSVPGVALTGGLGANALSGFGAGDSVVESIASSYTLSDTNLTGTGASFSDNLSGIRVANLTGNAFTVSGWTGSGLLAVPSGTGAVTASKDASFTLTNLSLVTSDGMALSLSRINVADLAVSVFAGQPTAIIDASAFSGVANLTATGTGKAILYGGAGGHDTLTVAGAGNNILIGNGADDTLTDSGSGRNILIGAGGGGDKLTGSGNDILVSGATEFDSHTSANIAALDAVLAEWTSRASYASRIKTLTKGVGKKHIDALSSHTIRTDTNTNTLADENARNQKGDWFLVSKRDSVTKNRKETRSII